MIGFDGETDADFMETVELICRYKLRYILASKYMHAEVSDLIRSDVVTEDDKQKRILLLAERVRQYGGIINYDGSELSKDRWNRLSN